jgi:hypothetical protein
MFASVGEVEFAAVSAHPAERPVVAEETVAFLPSYEGLEAVLVGRIFHPAQPAVDLAV